MGFQLWFCVCRAFHFCNCEKQKNNKNITCVNQFKIIAINLTFKQVYEINWQNSIYRYSGTFYVRIHMVSIRYSWNGFSPDDHHALAHVAHSDFCGKIKNVTNFGFLDWLSTYIITFNHFFIRKAIFVIRTQCERNLTNITWPLQIEIFRLLCNSVENG